MRKWYTPENPDHKSEQPLKNTLASHIPYNQLDKSVKLPSHFAFENQSLKSVNRIKFPDNAFDEIASCPNKWQQLGAKKKVKYIAE